MTTGMQTSRVFMNGRSQAVRIPVQFRFSNDEVFVNKIGDTLMITPVEKLAESLERGASMIPDDFMEEGMPDEIPVTREEF